MLVSQKTDRQPTPVKASAISYLPLGDSYTIGQSVATKDRWPNQLATKLQQAGQVVQIVANPSVTGYTSQDLIDRELPLLATYHPQFVTIQIGVNDYVQGVDAAIFQDNLQTIIAAVQRSQGNNSSILLVTIPDYGRTPAGARYGSPAESAIGIAAFNKIITATGTTYHIPVADIFEISQGVTADATLTANDGLHPSAKQYALWSNKIYATIQSSKVLLKDFRNRQ